MCIARLRSKKPRNTRRKSPLTPLFMPKTSSSFSERERATFKPCRKTTLKAERNQFESRKKAMTLDQKNLERSGKEAERNHHPTKEGTETRKKPV
jgi:hypothetical protein